MMRKLRSWVALAALSLTASVLAQTAPQVARETVPPSAPAVARVEPVDLNARPAHAMRAKAKAKKPKKGARKAIRKAAPHPRKRAHKR